MFSPSFRFFGHTMKVKISSSVLAYAERDMVLAKNRPKRFVSLNQSNELLPEPVIIKTNTRQINVPMKIKQKRRKLPLIPGLHHI